jgi:hypothetical protein
MLPYGRQRVADRIMLCVDLDNLSLTGLNPVPLIEPLAHYNLGGEKCFQYVRDA